MLDFSLQRLLLRLVATLLVLGVHGFLTALTVHALGDDGPKADGRRTANPFVHADTLGTILLLLFSLGWMKRMRVDWRCLRGGRWALAAIPPAVLIGDVLFAVALVRVQPLVLTALPGSTGFGVVALLNATAAMAIAFVVVNTVPLPPFTGFYWLEALVPGASRLATNEAFLKLAFAVVIVTGLGLRLARPAHDVLSAWIG